MNIAARITALCEQRNITVNKLATLSDIPYSTLREIASNINRDPQVGTIERICEGLGITLADFFNEDNPPAELPAEVWQAMQTISTYVKNHPGHF